MKRLILSNTLAFLLIFCSQVVGLEYRNEAVGYGGDFFERESQLPLDKRLDLGNGDFEHAVLYISAIPHAGDVDLVVTTCTEGDLYTDNIGYSYSYGRESLLVEVYEYERVCIHVIGQQRKFVSTFSLDAKLMRDEANQIVSAMGEIQEFDDYPDLFGSPETSATGSTGEAVWETLKTVGSGLLSLIVFVLKTNGLRII